MRHRCNCLTVSIDPEHYLCRVWLPQILSYAEMIDREADLRKAWVKGDRSRTSVHYPGELAEQINGLTRAIRGEIATRFADDRPLIEAIEDFLQSVDRLWFSVEATMNVEAWGRGEPIAGAADIFESREWLMLRDHARQLRVMASAAGVRSSDFSHNP